MIYLTGDIHGTLDINRLLIERFPEQHNLTKEDYVIILGDFGLIWNQVETKEEIYWLNWLDNKSFTTLFIDGNHENFDRLCEYPEVDMFGNKVGKISKSVFHLKRGRIYIINNKKFFTFGGAFSVDKKSRIPYISWWPEEYPSDEEINIGWKNLKKHSYNVDYVLTHAAPQSIVDEFSSDPVFLKASICPGIKIDDYVSKVLEEYKQKITFNKWFFGHYHFDNIINDKFEVLFKKMLCLHFFGGK